MKYGWEHIENKRLIQSGVFIVKAVSAEIEEVDNCETSFIRCYKTKLTIWIYNRIKLLSKLEIMEPLLYLAQDYNLNTFTQGPFSK